MLGLCFATRGQDRPQAVLVDEFGPMPCDEMLGRTDALVAEMMREPYSDAAILINKPAQHPGLATGRRKLIWSTLQLRGLESHRFSFYRSDTSPDGDIRTQFWKVPPGAEAPVTGFERWADEIPDTSRPFLFGSVDEINECPTYVPNAFAKLILDNPGSIGRIVVTTSRNSIVNRFSFGQQQVEELVNEHGVPRKRLRLIFRYDRDTTEAEFWFIPVRGSNR